MKKTLASLSLILALYSNVGLATTYGYIVNSGSGEVTVCVDGGSGGLQNCDDSGVGAEFSIPSQVAIPDQTFGGNTYAYVTNVYTQNVSQCELNTVDGTFVICDDSGAGAVFPSPYSMAFETVDSTLYAYVTSAITADVTKCTVNASTGAFSGCVTAIDAPILSSPRGLAQITLSDNLYTYITNRSAGTVTQCFVDPTSALLVNCFDSGAGAAFTTPENILFHGGDTEVYAYITDSTYDTDGGVWSCVVNSSTGQFSDCTSTGSGFSTPWGMSTVFGQPYLYISNPGSDEVVQCTLDAMDGSLDSCLSTATGFDSQGYAGHTTNWGMRSFELDGQPFFYITGPWTAYIQQCIMNGSSSSCRAVGEGSALRRTAPFMTTISDVTYLYTAAYDSFGSKTVELCVVGPSGQLSNCDDSGASVGGTPLDVWVGNVGTALVAYILQGIEVNRCAVSSGTGELSSCTTADMGEFFSGSADVLTVQVVDDTPYLYVVDPGDNTVYQCDLDTSTGEILSCSSLGYFDSPRDMAFATVDSVLYAYVTNYFSHEISQCVVNTSTGAFDSCSATTAGTSYPNYLELGTIEGDLYAYLQSGISTITLICTIDDVSGDFTSCSGEVPAAAEIVNLDITSRVTTGGAYSYLGLNENWGVTTCSVDELGVIDYVNCALNVDTFMVGSATDVAFIDLGSYYYAYITDADTGAVIQCNQDPDTGLLSGCADSGAGDVFGNPTGIVLNNVNGTLYSYITDSDDDRVVRCELALYAGTFSGCVEVQGIFDTPFGIEFNNGLAYIADRAGDRVVSCSLDGSGLFDSCIDSGAGAIFAEPADITFFTDAESNLNAYITNSSGDCDLPGNSATFCAVDSGTGLLSDCNNAGLEFVFDEPTGIAFSSDYAFISNSNSGDNRVSHCSLNADGSFEECWDSGANQLSRPIGIAFFTP